MEKNERLYTAKLREKAQGTLTRDITVTHRPQTGMRQVYGGVGGDRSVKDKSYWLSILRNKIKEIFVEIQNLKESIEKSKRNGIRSEDYKAQEDILKKEIKSHVDKLHSLNILLENIGKEEDLMGWLKNNINTTKTSRSTLEKEADDVLSKRKDMEDFISVIESKKLELKNNFERILNNNEVEKKTYLDLQNERGKMYTLIEEGKVKLSERERSLKEVKKVIEKDIKKISYLNRLEEKEEIIVKLNAAKKILSSHKNKNVELREMNEKLKVDIRRIIADIKNDTSRKKKIIDNINIKQRQLSAYSNPKGLYANYVSLREKDAKLNNFIKLYPSKLKSTKKSISRNQQIIVELVDFISKDLDLIKEKFENDKEIFSDKQKKHKDALNTLQKLEIKLKQKMDQSKNIERVNERIKKNRDQITKDIHRMKNELVTYNKIEELKENHENLRTELVKKKKNLMVLKNNQNNFIHRLQRMKEQKLKKLTLSSVNENLKDLELKIKTYNQNNYQMKKFVQEKTIEIQYSKLKENCLELQKELNGLIIERLNAK